MTGGQRRSPSSADPLIEPVAPPLRVSVLGAGSWGTTFGKVLVDAGCDVLLWARRPEIARSIAATGRNPDYLPHIRLPVGLRATSDCAQAMEHARDLLVLAVPSQTLRSNMAEWAPAVDPGAVVVSLAKGIELGSGLRMSEVIVGVSGIDFQRVAVVSGPNLAEEIAREQPTATVVACEDSARAQLVQRACTTRYLRPYTNPDIVGCELAGAMKNVIALACGIVSGMKLGDNATASVIARGLAEITRLGHLLGADPMTFAGLAGLGDVVATCYSRLSRNRGFGELLGRGQSMSQAQLRNPQVVEGVTSSLAVRDLALRLGVDMPLTDQIVKICHEDATPAQAFDELMARKPQAEFGIVSMQY
ncbi:MAG: glycerol-3-phosphate dehydrogenase [Acidimicrobiales bacterium]|nr:MAG: glycerol-3-phosphate dehydrogenase [Acidimicrobiales bacterium]